jgi:threonine synthase
MTGQINSHPVMIACTNCGKPYPQQGAPYVCPNCGGVFDYAGVLPYDPSSIDRSKPGIWRYAHSFGLAQGAAEVSLGEGNTPLVWTEAFGRRIALKCEHQNPSGSFKDRGSAVLTAFMLQRGSTHIVEDSSGNAGASIAAYAARAGMHARIYVPDSASGPKRTQIEAYGAEVVRVMGPRSNATRALRQALDRQPGAAPGGAAAAYASHAYLPFNLAGYATTAYEIYEQLGEAPGCIVAPAGQGGLLLGIGRGFEALKAAGIITRIPVLAGVQARACAPLWAVYEFGRDGLSWAAEAPTLAEGIRVLQPVRGDAVLSLLDRCQGRLVAVDEDEILPGRDALARRGFYVEPTSAVVWGAIHQLLEKAPEPIVAVLTGAGLKSSEIRHPG